MSNSSAASPEKVASAVADKMLCNTCVVLLKMSPEVCLCNSIEGDDVIRLPTVIWILSNGGIMSRDQRLELGKECALACSPQHYCHITVKKPLEDWKPSGSASTLLRISPRWWMHVPLGSFVSTRHWATSKARRSASYPTRTRVPLSPLQQHAKNEWQRAGPNEGIEAFWHRALQS